MRIFVEKNILNKIMQLEDETLNMLEINWANKYT